MAYIGSVGICECLTPLDSGVSKHNHGVSEYHKFADFLQHSATGSALSTGPIHEAPDEVVENPEVQRDEGDTANIDSMSSQDVARNLRTWEVWKLLRIFSNTLE